MNYSDFYLKENGKPLDFLLPDGGFTGIFRTVACIGDSLSSGEFQVVGKDGVTNEYYDYFDYSWGQYLARIAGLKAYNFSRGGMTAKEYLTNFARSNHYWDGKFAAQAYVVALGVNDVSGVLRGELEFGSVGDSDFENGGNGKETFCSYYEKILRRYREISPDSFLFLMTCPRTADEAKDRAELYDEHAAFLNELAKRLPRCYVLDFRKYAPVYDEEMKAHFWLNGHLNPMGYLLTAKMVVSYIDYIIRADMPTFAEAGFIGTPDLDWRKRNE